MTAFTRLGSGIWDWEPWTELPPVARVLWLALYTSGEAKRHVPGMWQGGIPSMADASRLKPDDVLEALDKLLERELVEYDPKTRVLRLCELPDAGEYPSNGKVIRGWWTRFKTVPACAVRDAHVRTLRWIVDTGSTLSGKALTPDHVAAWRDTFDTIPMPAQRRRGVRRLADSDTSTHAQPSLFPSPGQPLPSGNGIPSAGDGGSPQAWSPAVDNSASLRQINKNRAVDTVSDTVSDTNRIPDPGSRIPDSSLLLPERGFGGGHETGRPILTLVPPYGIADVFHAMAAARWDASSDQTHQFALSAMIPTWVSMGVGLADFARLAEYSQHANVIMSARWLMGCDLRAELATAQKTLDWRDVKMATMRESMP